MEDPQGLELTGTNWPTQTTTPPPTTRYGAGEAKKTTLRVHYTVQDQPQHQPPPQGGGSCTARQDVSVVIAGEPRPAPFRTRKLRPPAPMVLHPPGCGRVGHRRAHNPKQGRRPHTTTHPRDGMVWGLPTPHQAPTRRAEGHATTTPSCPRSHYSSNGCGGHSATGTRSRPRSEAVLVAMQRGGMEASHALTGRLRRCAVPRDGLEAFRDECGRRAVIAVVRLVAVRTAAGPTAPASVPARAGRCVDDP